MNNNNNRTPLRYPGGKSIFTDFFSAFIDSNKISDTVYIEPYCGGAGAAINLLLNGSVSRIWLNDANYSIYSFWYSLKHYGNEFLDLVQSTEVTLSEWRKQKQIFKSSDNKSNSKNDLLQNGFATFYLNRCNRSGILNAGPIGGQTEEGQLKATYKIDARFNKKNLLIKIKAIVDYCDALIVTNYDAIELLNKLTFEQSKQFQSKCFVYLDPPYYKQGSGLYLNYYQHDDHKIIADYLSKDFPCRWLLSYDNVQQIRNLYSSFPLYAFYLNYSAQESKLGSELLIHSKNSHLPESLIIKRLVDSNKKIELQAI